MVTGEVIESYQNTQMVLVTSKRCTAVQKRKQEQKKKSSDMSAQVSGFNFMLFYNEPLDCRDYRGLSFFCLLFVK